MPRKPVPRGTMVRRLKTKNWMYGHITGHVGDQYLIQWEVSQPSELHDRSDFNVLKNQEAARQIWLDRPSDR